LEHKLLKWPSDDHEPVMPEVYREAADREVSAPLHPFRSIRETGASAGLNPIVGGAGVDCWFGLVVGDEDRHLEALGDGLRCQRWQAAAEHLGAIGGADADRHATGGVHSAVGRVSQVEPRAPYAVQVSALSPSPCPPRPPHSSQCWQGWSDPGSEFRWRSPCAFHGRSPQMVRRVIGGLGALVADAQERRLTMRNPVREMRASRGKRRTKATRNRKRQLAVGVDIPTPAEIKAILNAATGFRRALFATAALGGLRSSELLGLRWQDVDLARAAVSVWQRADSWGTIDQPKSDAGNRTVPVPPFVVNALREWKLACPRRDTGQKDAAGNPIKEIYLVFPNGAGNVKSRQNVVQRHWQPLQIAAGVSVPVLDEADNPVMALDDSGKPLLDDKGKPIPVMAAKYSGLHALRHFFCSWCAARPQDGGLGLPLKTVQHPMGHSTLAMTADRYGHLFPSQDDAEVLAAGERALMGG